MGQFKKGIILPFGQIGSQTFTFGEHAAIARIFSPGCFLGEGGFGSVYRGQIQGSGQVFLALMAGYNFFKSASYTIEILSTTSFANEKDNLRRKPLNLKLK
ncbi:putative non-specific serine/threonine protein kinase [Helianthus anomalus]